MTLRERERERGLSLCEAARNAKAKARQLRPGPLPRLRSSTELRAPHSQTIPGKEVHKYTV